MIYIRLHSLTARLALELKRTIREPFRFIPSFFVLSRLSSSLLISCFPPKLSALCCPLHAIHWLPLVFEASTCRVIYCPQINTDTCKCDFRVPHAHLLPNNWYVFGRGYYSNIYPSCPNSPRHAIFSSKLGAASLSATLQWAAFFHYKLAEVPSRTPIPFCARRLRPTKSRFPRHSSAAGPSIRFILALRLHMSCFLRSLQKFSHFLCSEARTSPLSTYCTRNTFKDL